MDVISEINRTEGLTDALRCVVHAFGAETGTFHVLQDDGLLHLKAINGYFPPSVLAVIQQIPVGKGMAGLAVERAQPVDACNIQTDGSGDVRPGARATGMEGASALALNRSTVRLRNSGRFSAAAFWLMKACSWASVGGVGGGSLPGSIRK